MRGLIVLLAARACSLALATAYAQQAAPVQKLRIVGGLDVANGSV